MTNDDPRLSCDFTLLRLLAPERSSWFLVGLCSELGDRTIWQNDSQLGATPASSAYSPRVGSTCTDTEGPQVPARKSLRLSSIVGCPWLRQASEEERLLDLGLFHPAAAHPPGGRETPLQDRTGCKSPEKRSDKTISRRQPSPDAKSNESGKGFPHMRARHEWKVYLDCEEAIENAMAYVMDNPVKEGKPKQEWSWLSPFAGIEPGWVTYL